MTYSIKQLLSRRRRLSSRFAKRSRKLSSGEVKLARSVFGDSIDLDSVQLKTAWWVLKNYAVSPNGNIYFH
ncbi:type IV secretion protein Rhs, partial [Psychrobacter sp. 1U2]